MTYRTESMHNFKINYTLRMRNPQEYQLTDVSFLGADKPDSLDSLELARGAESQREIRSWPHSGNGPLALRTPYGLII